MRSDAVISHTGNIVLLYIIPVNCGNTAVFGAMLEDNLLVFRIISMHNVSSTMKMQSVREYAG